MPTRLLVRITFLDGLAFHSLPIRAAPALSRNLVGWKHWNSVSHAASTWPSVNSLFLHYWFFILSKWRKKANCFLLFGFARKVVELDKERHANANLFVFIISANFFSVCRGRGVDKMNKLLVGRESFNSRNFFKSSCRHRRAKSWPHQGFNSIVSRSNQNIFV